MKKRSLLPALFTAVLCASAQEAGLVAKPIRYAFNTQNLADLPMGVRLHTAGDTIGCEVTYLVMGDGLTAINHDSIDIHSITDKDGKDLARDYRGLATWKFGQFPVISDDNAYAFFSIFVATDDPLTVPHIKGSIHAATVNKTKIQTETLTFNTAGKNQGQKIGPFSFSIHESPLYAFAIRMKGNRHLLVDGIKVNAGGKAVKQNGWGASPGETTYQFDDAPKTPEFTLSVSYYTEMKDVTVTFGQKEGEEEKTAP